MPAGTRREGDGREAALLGHRHDREGGARDHAERALGADEHLRQLGADGVARHRDGVDQPAGRRRHPQRQHEILDLAVAGREHPRAARRDVAADRRPLDRRGVMRQHQPARVELVLELAAVLARLHGHCHRGLVDLEHLVKRAQVDNDAAMDGQRPALGAGAAAPWDHRHAVLVGDLEHGRDFLFGTWPYDGVGARQRRSCGLCGQRRPVRIGGVLLELVRCGKNRPCAQRGGERRLDVGQISTRSRGHTGLPGHCIT